MIAVHEVQPRCVGAGLPVADLRPLQPVRTVSS